MLVLLLGNVALADTLIDEVDQCGQAHQDLGYDICQDLGCRNLFGREVNGSICLSLIVRCL